MGIDIKVNAFEGPLDLLLHLIEKNKVDIYDIPISEITSQYLDYIRSMEEEDLDVLSDFLVMAATLLKIKAKMLLPVKEEEEEEGDPREELVRRLIEYKIYKYASLQLPTAPRSGIPTRSAFRSATGFSSPSVRRLIYRRSKHFFFKIKLQKGVVKSHGKDKRTGIFGGYYLSVKGIVKENYIKTLPTTWRCV